MVVAPNDYEPKPTLPFQRRVLYIGSAVPVETSTGLEAVQHPLKERYPVDDDEDVNGIDSLITILPNGIQLQYVGDADTVIWFPITSLTLCAAVRCIKVVNAATGYHAPKFVSLSSPAAEGVNAANPAIFTAITRRTTGRKVLECHGFVCRKSQDAMDLVQCTKQADARFNKFPNVSFNRSNNTSFVSNAGNAVPQVSPPFQVPVILQPANEDGATVIPELNGAPPKQGYFYSSGNNLVRTFTISRTTHDPSPDRFTVNGDVQKKPFFINLPSRASGYHYRSNFIRAPPPGMMHLSPGTLTRPNYMRPQHIILRPNLRSFPPPRMGSAYRSLPRDPYVFQQKPVPMVFNPPHWYRNIHDLGNRSTSTDSDSSTYPRRVDEQTYTSSNSSTLIRQNVRQPFIQGHDTSSDEASPGRRTPPADYEPNNGKRRMSRKDKHEIQQAMLSKSDTNEYGYISGVQFRHPHPLYDTPNWSHTRPMRRYKSMPPLVYQKPRRAKSSKKKKEKKSKKKRSKSSSKSHGHDNYRGYMSEVPAAMMEDNLGIYTPKQRDHIWLGNQFGNEKAFSQSLMRESKMVNFDDAPTAYSINQPVFDKNKDLELKFD